MDETRTNLLEQLQAHYRSAGWRVRQGEHGHTVEADGPGGVTWIGMAIVPGDISDGVALEQQLLALADRRMAKGERCPLDLLADERCEADVRVVLERSGLSRRPHVSVYSLAATA